MKLLLGVLLFFLSSVLASVLIPLGMVYGFFRTLSHSKALDAYGFALISMAILIDRAGNVILGPLMNDLLRTRMGYRFGDERDTISYVLGRNKEELTLTWLGRVIADILNWVEEDHVEKAVVNKGN